MDISTVALVTYGPEMHAGQLAGSFGSQPTA